MVRAGIGRRTSDGTTGAAALEIIGPLKGCFVREIMVSLAAATASTYGLGRPAAKGTTPTAPVTSLVDSGGDALSVQTQTAIAWGVGPTAPVQFFRRVSFPATIGSVILWTFAGLFIPPGGTLVLWNLAANGLVDVSIVTEDIQV